MWQHILKPLFHYSGIAANLMYHDTLLVDTSTDETDILSLFSEHGECEILHKIMEEGLSLNDTQPHNDDIQGTLSMSVFLYD